VPCSRLREHVFCPKACPPKAVGMAPRRLWTMRVRSALIQGPGDAVWFPPPLWGRVRVGGTAFRNRVLVPPTPTLPHKGGGRLPDTASRSVHKSRLLVCHLPLTMRRRNERLTVAEIAACLL
jgi:hypothetical protein